MFLIYKILHENYEDKFLRKYLNFSSVKRCKNINTYFVLLLRLYVYKFCDNKLEIITK